MDKLRKIDLNLLLTLHALLAEKHVSRAALRLHRSQPAVSHALAQLRLLLDDPLLVHRDGKMSLTEKAHSLARPLHESLSRLDELLDTASFDPLTTQRRFRISLSDYAARIVLPLLVRRLRTEAPGIELAISQVSREAMLSQLIDGELDLALGIFPSPPEGVEVESLFEERFISIVDEGTLPEDGQLPLGEWLARPHARIALRPDVTDEIDIALQLLELKRRQLVEVSLPFTDAELFAAVSLP